MKAKSRLFAALLMLAMIATILLISAFAENDPPASNADAAVEGLADGAEETTEEAGSPSDPDALSGSGENHERNDDGGDSGASSATPRAPGSEPEDEGADDPALPGNGEAGRQPAAPTHTVTFSANGHGAAPDAVAVTEGETLPKPADPAEDGYTFTGWYKDRDGTDAWNFDADTVNGNITLYAGWMENASGALRSAPALRNGNTDVYFVTVTNNGYGSAEASPTSGAAGTEVTLTARPNTGYRLREWQIVSGDATVEGNKLKIGTSAVEVKAIFEEIPRLIITAIDQSYTYNGEYQGEGDTIYADPAEIAQKARVEGLKEGDYISVLMIFSQGIDAGDYPIEVGPLLGVRNRNDENVKDNYRIEFVNGTMTIEPAELTVVTGSDSKVYDGSPLTADGAAIEGFVKNDTAIVTANGSQTDAGTSQNTYEIEWGATTKSSNYRINENLGTLTVEPKPVTVAANDASKVCGEADPTLTATATGLVGGDTVHYSVSRAAGEDAGTYAITPTGEAAQGNYTVSFVPGTFTIVPRATTAVIRYNLNGGTLNGKTGTVTIQAENGETIALPAPTRAGYAFDYWEGSRYNAGDSYTVNGDHTFTARWRKNGSGAPETGDGSALALWSGITLLSGAAMIALLLYARKRRA